ncbi:hypothetical protein SCHPADRAFT_964682 [Schizopora paradoxa]|uniref:Uncharacterized protein n=1 Tax=Schizopora paradoxa TaxID=27342 RepID=A0A0H2RTL6_9AGAM|nr:hypothetical protein SCHPADRAFT_964682 [Schizopora paradoxa]
MSQLSPTSKHSQSAPSPTRKGAASKVINSKYGDEVLRVSSESEDPYYYYDEFGKKRKVGQESCRCEFLLTLVIAQRPLPEGLTKKQQKTLSKVRYRAHMLDNKLSFCGKRFGWGSVLSVIPGIGEMGDLVLGATLIIRKCNKEDIPISLRAKMFSILGSACLVGIIPVVGPVLYTQCRPNTRNAHLFEEWLKAKAAETEAPHSGTFSRFTRFQQ